MSSESRLSCSIAMTSANDMAELERDIEPVDPAKDEVPLDNSMALPLGDNSSVGVSAILLLFLVDGTSLFKRFPPSQPRHDFRLDIDSLPASASTSLSPASSIPAVTTTASLGVRISSPLEAEEVEDTSLRFEWLRSDSRGVIGDIVKSSTPSEEAEAE